MGGLALAHDDASVLAAFLRRLRDRDERATVRVQVRGRAIGVFGALPGRVLALLVVPLASPAPAPVDAVVSAGRLRDVLGELTAPVGEAPPPVLLRLPDPVDGPGELVDLPPSGGWSLVRTVLAGELAAAPHGAAALRTVDGEWDPLVRWAGELGLLASPTAQIHLGQEPLWLRLQSPAGQVFARRPGSPGGISAPSDPPGRARH